MTALQLRLPYVPPPGICRVEHCGNRLSVANTDGICDQRHACPLPEYPAFLCIICKVGPATSYHGKCTECRRQYDAGRDWSMVNARKRQQRRQAARGQGVGA